MSKFANTFLMLAGGSLALGFSGTLLADVESRDDWTKRYAVSSAEPVLEIRNIWGDVRVVPGEDGEIILSVREHRSAPNQALYERSLEVFPLNVVADPDGVDIRVGDQGRNWNGHDRCRDCQVTYQFEVRVPSNAKVYASTVVDGEVEVTDIAGRVSAGNVNGPVRVSNAADCESVESVNGDVSVSFFNPPATDCHIETVNGDIRVQVPERSGLDVAVDLFNGRLTSELPVDPLALPARVERRQKGGRNIYTIDQAAGVRLAGGGPMFSIASMNGDVRIEKKQ